MFEHKKVELLKDETKLFICNNDGRLVTTQEQGKCVNVTLKRIND